jgi:hypothetical protein
LRSVLRLRAIILLISAGQRKGRSATEQGDTGDGSVSYADMAKVLVQSLRSAQAVGKAFEVYSAPQARRTRREPAFDELVHDNQAFHAIDDPGAAKTYAGVIEQLCAQRGQQAASCSA